MSSCGIGWARQTAEDEALSPLNNCRHAERMLSAIGVLIPHRVLPESVQQGRAQALPDEVWCNYSTIHRVMSAADWTCCRRHQHYQQGRPVSSAMWLVIFLRLDRHCEPILYAPGATILRAP